MYMKGERNMSFMDELFRYRVKVEKDGKEIANVPGILALPGALIAPKISIAGAIAASLLGCSIHLENENGKTVNAGQEIRKAADTVMDTAKTAAKTVREEFEKAWNDLSADDPEGCPEGQENEEEATSDEKPGENSAEDAADEPEKPEADDIPVIHVEKPDKPE